MGFAERGVHARRLPCVLVLRNTILATLVLIGTVVSPIGMLLWGASVDYLSSPITVGLAAIVILVLAAVLARSRPQGSAH